MNSTVDPRKGFAELVNAINCINESTIELVIFGNRTDELKTVLKHKIHFVGELFDTQSLVALYNAVDVMIVPSKQENLSNIIMESLSCGTPVVGFDIGGNSDMIDHKVNGYLAIPGNSLDLSKGIEFILDCGPENYRKFCENSIEKINHMFCEDKVVKKYIVEYQNILNTND